ncbi:hypothetical protein DERP_004483 [Dermatophagoides pteronyssinus]|uniref:Uncharacterized protein n=1 Tax=Dermatophagoides pteronyssinus TaxID=6956 RepID=A0ABQ8JPT1_DERPT|nr:hypothetical protein DERP_004483 [Dermatophagoides pteronyssinus]
MGTYYRFYRIIPVLRILDDLGLHIFDCIGFLLFPDYSSFYQFGSGPQCSVAPQFLLGNLVLPPTGHNIFPLIWHMHIRNYDLCLRSDCDSCYPTFFQTYQLDFVDCRGCAYCSIK